MKKGLQKEHKKVSIFYGMVSCKRKLSLIYRSIVRQLFRLYISLSDKKYIIAKIDHPSLSNYFNWIIGAAWLCDKMNVNLEFVFPRENPHFFENSVLYFNHRNKVSGKKFFIKNYLASIARKAARKDLFAEYGHKVISQLSVKQDIQHRADEWFETHIKGDWLAVHYRGTDIHTEPVRKLPIDSYILWLKKVVDHNKYNIFVCSDQAQFVDKMRLAFPNRVYSREIKRSIDSQAIHLPHDSCADDTTFYEQKMDALIDILILAKADMIYTTGSGFVDVVRYFNPKIKIVSLDGRRMGREENKIYVPRGIIKS